MSLELDLSRLVAGGPQGSVGIAPADLDAAAHAHPGHLQALLDKRSAGRLGFFDLPDQAEVLADIKAFADRQHGRFENIVVLGIGGSALGTRALHAALSPALHDHRPHDGTRPKLFVVDNVDPVLVGGILRAANPGTTLYNVISKSGSTAETMSQFLLVLEALKHAVGEHWREHVVVTTDEESGFLRPFATQHGLQSFSVPSNVGGRFSVLSPVGLVPGALMGWDLDELLAGAAEGRERALSENFERNPAALLAVTQHLFDTRHGHNVQVLFPYSHKLRLMGDWLVQLVAESLGKPGPAGAGVGPTPHAAIGATDQHSQVQLFVEGPRDKVFSFVRVLKHQDDVVIPAPPEGLAGLAYLGGKTFGQLLDAECRATELALTDAGRPSCRITFPEVDARHVGEFLMWMQIATAYSGELYGIDAFDQPGVEGGKRATYGLMGRDGFEDERRRVEEAPPGDPRWRLDG